MKTKQFIILVSSLLIIFFSLNCSSSKEGTSEANKEKKTNISKTEAQVKNSVTKAPRMLLAEERYIFKDIEEGTPVVHEFGIKNIGTDTLYITDIETSCGCTVAMPDSKSIAPNNVTKLKVTFNTTGKVGINTKMITIHSNDSAAPNKVIQIEGKVLAKSMPK
jgi:hypothetical protein